ncbi:hypothetical protein LDC_1499 [sediment metagenome]|uniref:Tetratricopeptide repeat protein n=1 Tax=sediment metagenome TaxID=749907 RepID=D9PIZ0_9ZZZZ
MYLNLRQFAKSRKFYEFSSRLSKDNNQLVRVLICMGNLSLTKGSYEEAILSYEKALNISRYKTTILSNLAFTYEALGENEKALKYAEESIEVSRREFELGHTISPEDNVKDLIIRLKEKLPRLAQ